MYKFRLISVIILVTSMVFAQMYIIPATPALAVGPTIYTFSFDKSLYNEPRADTYDQQLFIATLQGIVNRKGPRLYLMTSYKPAIEGVTATQASQIDEYWFNKFRQPGQWLSEYNVVNLSTLDDVVNTFRNDMTGITVWDPKVDATSNVAVTVAGVENAPAVMADGALYQKLIAAPFSLTVVQNLKNRFSGVNAKYDAYNWAKTNYLDNGRCNAGFLAYIEDSNVRTPGTFHRRYSAEFDYVVKNKGFAFDLSPYDDGAPTDAPNQNITYDKAMFTGITQSSYNLWGAYWPTRVIGFFPWYDKYTDYYGGLHDGVSGEWEYIKLLSQKNAAVVDVNDTFGMANASFHSWAPIGAKHRQQQPPARKTLANKTYILIYNGDSDGGQMHHHGVMQWDDPMRGSLPIAWSNLPYSIDDYPDIMQYFYDTATPNDYFVAGCSGAGYINPGYTPVLDVWKEFNKYYYDRSGYTMTGFLLNGYGGAVSNTVEQAYADFSREGLGGYNNTLQDPQFGVRNGNMAVARMDLLISRNDINDAASVIYSETAQLTNPGTTSNFLFFRSTYGFPHTFKALYDKIKAEHPEYNYEVVDPHTFFSLIRQKYNNQANDAISVNVSVPKDMVVGEKYDVEVTVQNTGSNGWINSGLYRLGSGSQNQFYWSDFENGGISNDSNKAAQRAYLSLTETVAPQSSKTFRFKITAPSTAGSYKFEIQMVQDGVQWFGNVDTKTVNVVNRPANGAIIAGITAPEYLDEGSTGTVSVTVKNVGTSTWTNSGNYRFGSSNTLANKTMIPNRLSWNCGVEDLDSQRAYLSSSDSIAPGQSKTFNITVTAPSARGIYTFSGKMVRDGVEWFGTQIYKDIKVVPKGRSSYAFRKIGTTLDGAVNLLAGQTVRVSVTVKNTGTSDWTSAGNFRLAAAASNQFLFSNFKDGGYSNSATDQRVYLSTVDVIKPEGTKTFTFDITAPATAGSYTFSVDMIKEGTAWFGTPITLPVQVKSGMDATILDSGVKLTMAAGSSQNVAIEVLNTGANIWNQAGLYRLAATTSNQFLFSGFAFGGFSNSATDQRVYLSAAEHVPQNRYTNFYFTIWAPSTPGTYTLALRMVRDGVAWFGQEKQFTIQVVDSYVKRVNCGGASYTDASGTLWEGDQAYNNNWGYTGTTQTYSTSHTIDTTSIPFTNGNCGGVDPQLFKKYRSGTSFGYRFNVPNGKYLVSMLFCEINYASSYQRHFNLSMEGKQYLTGFDVYKKALGHDRGLAMAYSYVSVTDGVLNLDFEGLTGEAMISGLQIVRQN